MFYSKSIDEIKIGFFLSLLAHKIAGDAVQEEAYIEEIVSDVRALARSEKSFYEVDREGYPIVIALYDLDKDYFRDLDIHAMTTADYERMHKTLLNQPEFA
ncbi:hypothetical protein D3C86_1972100 [compost metagenome]